MSVMHEFMTVLGKPMAIVGIAGQALFASRFLVQWIASERRRESVVPVSFWYLSLVGGAMTAVYAVWRRDAIFLLAQVSGMAVYARNLSLIRRQRAAVRQNTEEKIQAQ